jgi:MoxR-like ATPase
MLCHRLGYPRTEDEREILRRSAKLGIRRQDGGAVARTEFDAVSGAAVAGINDLVNAMEAVHEVHVSETFTDYVVELVERTRRHPLVELGASPRAGIALVKASRARALIHGRHYVIPEDLFALAEDTLLHRMRLSYEALAEGYSGADVLRSLLDDFGAAKRSNGKAAVH